MQAEAAAHRMWALDGGTLGDLEAPVSPRGQPASPWPSLGLSLPDAAPQGTTDDEQRTEGLSHTASARKACDPIVCIWPHPLQKARVSVCWDT